MNLALKIVAFLTFALVITPLGIALRLLRFDFLEQRIDKTKKSYWRSMSRWDRGRAEGER